jgi:uncharacterized protein DUF4386
MTRASVAGAAPGFPQAARYARFAGLMYFVVLAFDIAGLVLTMAIAGSAGFLEASQRISGAETLYRIGLCCGLLGAIATIPLAVGLYAAVRRADPDLAVMALLFRTAEAAIGATGIVASFYALQLHLGAAHPGALTASQLGTLAELSQGVSTQVAALFFSVGSSIFFYLLLRSNFIPRLLSGWGLFASIAYALVWLISLVAPSAAGTVQLVGSLPILIAELSTGFWLLTRGIRLERAP